MEEMVTYTFLRLISFKLPCSPAIFGSQVETIRPFSLILYKDINVAHLVGMFISLIEFNGDYNRKIEVYNSCISITFQSI